MLCAIALLVKAIDIAFIISCIRAFIEIQPFVTSMANLYCNEDLKNEEKENKGKGTA